jgi:hypothetical protein
MSKLIRSVFKNRGLFNEKETKEKCENCHKKPAGKDGLCNSCRFDALLNQIVENRENP